MLYSRDNLPFSQSVSQTCMHLFKQALMHLFNKYLPSPRYVGYIQFDCVVLIYIVSHSVMHT